MPKRIFHGKTKTREWTSWMAMKSRCYSVSNPAYSNYGGRGIKVCERWQGIDGFLNFLKDMGERPRNTSIDRIDMNGNYEPNNCRWATKQEQQLNRRTNFRITYNGKSQTYTEWAKYLNMNPNTLYGRLKSWNVERAFTEPINQKFSTRSSK